MFHIRWRDALGYGVTDGGLFQDAEEQRARDRARELYYAAPNLYPDGIRVHNWRDRIVYSIGAEHTYTVQVYAPRRDLWLDVLGSGTYGLSADGAETRVKQLERQAQQGFELGIDAELFRYRVLKDTYPMDLVKGKVVSLSRARRLRTSA